ncbi:FH1/FH2 domain-containing protein 3 [Araneus ventricosus]|uniref:FH1/FH2 domain-containing protein 3 n=1 Tax=Araneus ventricosus TaxID=182803 RepID=A0A4Y2IUH9_ARAVE|nr:FH1/FH2 domain-containing protein 3 [Araneus ventricosus]
MTSSDNRDLRRTLYSLKQVFQDEKDLASAFIESGGLNSLVKVASSGDQTNQNYILRALGQLMLFVDGMYEWHCATFRHPEVALQYCCN